MLRRVGSSYKTKVVRHGSGAAAAAKDAGKALLQIVRFDPETNSKRVESYEFDKKQDFMVLDLLTAVKAHQDPSLAFRASCCEGVCGSCAMNINGINSLACVTFAQHVTTVGPLPNFPVVKDLVVDLRGFFRQYEYIRPFVRNVNLQRYHIDSVYRRYTETCRALFGANTEIAAGEASDAKESSGDTKVTALLKVLDSVVAAGNVSQTLHVLRKLQALGMVFNDDRLRQLLRDCIAAANKSPV